MSLMIESPRVGDGRLELTVASRSVCIKNKIKRVAITGQTKEALYRRSPYKKKKQLNLRFFAEGGEEGGRVGN